MSMLMSMPMPADVDDVSNVDAQDQDVIARRG
jgi:hypothetical protein